MTDESPQGDHGRSGPETPPGVPRWVKSLAVIALLVIVALVIVALLIGGDHGPGRHGLGAPESAAEILSPAS